MDECIARIIRYPSHVCHWYDLAHRYMAPGECATIRGKTYSRAHCFFKSGIHYSVVTEKSADVKAAEHRRMKRIALKNYRIAIERVCGDSPSDVAIRRYYWGILVQWMDGGDTVCVNGRVCNREHCRAEALDKK